MTKYDLLRFALIIQKWIWHDEFLHVNCI